ncbi:hypothetical protein B0T22DRAFT_501726 [Podospora appendiculata]|uniref:Uncharacterized protein n=1 Tax=Podospora appendiculata TaxID=314037 RepID=A0AAE0X0P5_9PEZI|nr:hypothetical protein B0T22DRAFT_501726 [Podospora appendiculata]
MVKEMMKEPEHAMWHAHSLEKMVEERMGRNSEALKNTVEAVCEMMTALQQELQCFAPLEEEHDRKLRKRAKITLEKSNDSLRRLRGQVDELQKPQKQTATTMSTKCPERKGQLPAEFEGFGAIRRASKALHEALSAAWSSPQLRHSVRLFLNARAAQDVQMEVAIMCYGGQQHMEKPLLLPTTGLVRWGVRSRTIDSTTWINTGLGTPESDPDTTNAPPPTKSERRKRQKVRFGAFTDDNSGTQNARNMNKTSLADSSLQPVATIPPPPAELPLSGHFCSELLQRSAHLAPEREASRSLGHIDSCALDRCRHSFYPAPPDTQSPAQRRWPRLCPDHIVPVDDLLCQPGVHNRLTVVDQLRLALRLASAVLQFSSTPWLHDIWSVRDLAFFRHHEDDDLSTSLQTLHFSNTVLAHDDGKRIACSMSFIPDIDMDRDSSTTASLIQDAQYRHGVRNVTLHSLGVALLSIGRWENVNPDDVEGVRRLAAQSCYLGPKYQELTERVLDCDFGYGKDLRKPRLQEAVHETVVLELETMVAGLELVN